MVIGAHIWGEDIEESLLLFALKKTASLQPVTKFIFFTNSPLTHLPQNCLQVNINPRLTNKVLLYYWYNYKLPKLLLKYNINSFISNIGMLASGISINQFLFIEHKDLFEERNSFFKKRLGSGVAIAQTIFVIDYVIGESISKQFPPQARKIQPLNFSLNDSSFLFTLMDIERVREKYTEGFDYYLFRVDDTSKAHILGTLKSFSQLKKWQKTALKMILLFENNIDDKLLPDFKNYKYRNEVVLLKETNENLLLLTAAAFACIYFGDYKSRDSVYKALQYNIPVIAADTVINNLLFKSAVCYAVATVDGLALQLQLIYKDEVYRKQLLQKSAIYLTNFDSITASQKFSEVILS
jgi:hypothetical protein